MASNNSEYFDSRMAEILGMHDIAALYRIKDFFLFILFVHFWYIIMHVHFPWFYI